PLSILFPYTTLFRSDLPCPMSLLLITKTIERAERRFYGKLLAPISELGPTVKVFYGRVYFNVDQMRHICRLTGIAPASILRSIGDRKSTRLNSSHVK